MMPSRYWSDGGDIDYGIFWMDLDDECVRERVVQRSSGNATTTTTRRRARNGR